MQAIDREPVFNIGGSRERTYFPHYRFDDIDIRPMRLDDHLERPKVARLAHSTQRDQPDTFEAMVEHGYRFGTGSHGVVPFVAEKEDILLGRILVKTWDLDMFSVGNWEVDDEGYLCAVSPAVAFLGQDRDQGSIAELTGLYTVPGREYLASPLVHAGIKFIDEMNKHGLRTDAFFSSYRGQGEELTHEGKNLGVRVAELAGEQLDVSIHPNDLSQAYGKRFLLDPSEVEFFDPTYRLGDPESSENAMNTANIHDLLNSGTLQIGGMTYNLGLNIRPGTILHAAHLGKYFIAHSKN